MSRYIGKKEVTLVYYGKKPIIAIYKGLKLIMQMGNFFTRDGELFTTKNGDTFEVKENT